MSDATPQRRAELEAAVQADPGGPAFPELAELHRRAGDPAAAERVASRGLERSPDSARGRAALLLALVDAGRSDELRRRLEAWAAVPEPGPAPMLFPDAEFERAFDAAEPELDAMITPDSVAEEAALRVDGMLATTSPLETGGAFSTRTMAELLERQGDAAGAARIRAALDAPRASERPASAPRSGALGVLERWLANARRMQS